MIPIPTILVILGAIFFVIGLFRGNIKIKGVEIPPITTVIQIILVVIGLVFIVGGIGLNFIPTSPTPHSGESKPLEEPRNAGSNNGVGEKQSVVTSTSHQNESRVATETTDYSYDEEAVSNGYMKDTNIVTVTNPKNGSEIGREITVEGTASIPEGNHLWVLARRVDFEPLWYPQREAKIDPITHKWVTTACFGGTQDINWDFHIGVLTVNAADHKKLMNYWIKAMKTGDWRPIQISETTSLVQILKVRKVSH